MKDKLMNQLRLCLVTSIQGDLTSYAKTIRGAIRGGVTMVQLREKLTDQNRIKEKAKFLRNILRPLGVPLIINDYVELAAEVDADGVHIGQQDVPVSVARRILGQGKIIGLSIESFADLHAANKCSDLSYVTASAVFPSMTKPDCKTIWGLGNLKQLVAESSHPITAIGGINDGNCAEVLSTGVCGIAVVGAIHNAPDPYQAAQRLMGSSNLDHRSVVKNTAGQ